MERPRHGGWRRKKEKTGEQISCSSIDPKTRQAKSACAFLHLLHQAFILSDLVFEREREREAGGISCPNLEASFIWRERRERKADSPAPRISQVESSSLSGDDLLSTGAAQHPRKAPSQALGAPSPKKPFETRLSQSIHPPTNAWRYRI